MQMDHHHFDGVEVAFVCAAAVSFAVLIASITWLFMR
ncbi:hypothetical protein ACVWY5_001569 [Bradyrhizobium sp. USDA 3256]